MATFSITANSYLRSCYSYDRSLVRESARSEASESKLSYADSSALKRAIRSLRSVDYTSEDSDKKKFENHLKAFVDSYNFSLTSGKNSSSSKIRSTTDKMKSLTNKYESQLKNLGISINEKNGYMTLSSSATTNISVSQFKEMFSEESDYLKDLEAYSKKVNHSIDIVL